jgi:hypothetical protein
MRAINHLCSRQIAGLHLLKPGLVQWICLLVGFGRCLEAAPLASLDYHIGGTFLQVSPTVLSVPKGVPGSVLVSIVSGGSTNSAAGAQLATGAYVQAIIRGPGFPQPQRIVGAPNAPLLLPPINLVGGYELDSIALVDAVTGQTRLEGTPSSVPVNVFDQLLISSVTSQPLTIDQIQQAGIAIDESNFRAVQFNVEFVLDGQTIPVTFPVVSPKFTDSTELIPQDQVESLLQQAALINQQIATTMVQLPPGLQQTANLNIQLQGLNFQVADPSDPAALGLAIPPIPALMVIPGNIGFLHQFFSVKIFTENGAPLGSGLSVDGIMAQLSLPPGPDGIVSTNYNQPGDDPLRFARIGPNKVIQPIQPVVDPGPDAQLGTADDISRLQPGETGQAEFFVEGLQEGLWVMNLDLTGNLYGLPAGVVAIKGKAAGSVLVRNPTFSLTFTHPDVVRVSEPYTASITILNTGITPANLVEVSLNKNSISGAILDVNQPEAVQLGTILPGQSATAVYHLISQRTGQVTFSDITTSDNSVLGRFRFTMGVDAQGVPLSPDTIAMPGYVNYLPADLVAAATRVLGQALSIATAAQLPPGIVPVGNSIITRRVLDLAEAGQRVHYGDPLERVLADLLRDWQGGRVTDDGFDSLLRTSDAGAQWVSVLFSDMEITDGLTGTGRLLDRAADLAGLGQQFVLASAGPGQLRADFSGTTNSATLPGSSQPYALDYAGTNGEWALTPYLSNALFTWTFTNGPPQADLAVLLVGTNGQARQLRWQIPNPPVTAIYTFALSDPNQRLQIDTTGDGTIDQTLNPTTTTVNELSPTLVAVQQDLTVVAGRPANPCVGPDYGNYGTVVAVVYSKPMTQNSAGATNSYTLEGANSANSVQIQPSGRVALLNLRKGISAILPRKLTVTGVSDVRGNPLVAAATPVQCLYPATTNRFTGGVAVTGRVIKGDGSPAPGVPVTLTMYDEVHAGEGCMQWIRRVSQVLTDSGGNFFLDYVMSGIPYSLSASDTSTLQPGALQLILSSTIADQPDAQELQQIINASSNPNSLLSLLSAGTLPQAVAIVQGLDRAVIHDVVGIGSSREGQTVPFALRFRGRGFVTGQVVAADGVTPVPNAAVNLFPDPSSLELGRGVFSDGAGQFAFTGIPLGVFSIQVATSDNRGATVLGLLDMPGETTNVVIALPTNVVLYATLGGQVFDSDNITPVPNAKVFIGQYAGTVVKGVVSIVTADATGSWIATNVPIRRLDVVAVTFDGTRKGVRSGIVPNANSITYANVTLEAATTVYGQVTFDDGRPATNALVAGGIALVRSDVNGNFQLQGVPVGSAIISAGLERNPAAGINFPRLGSSSANIVEGEANYVVVKLRPAGRIFGKVFDAQGNIQPGIRVAIPQQGGFYWTDADTNGNYVFENLGLGGYTLSAPANAVAPQLNQSDLLNQINSGDEQQILAAFNEAITVFVGANDPLINGDQLKFRPSSWGFTTANIAFDGANVNADIKFIVQGSVSGTVLNGQGVPIGAAVRLTGLGPDVTGAPVTTIRGDTTSDPATGAFGFTNVLLAGPFGVQAASPFYPVVVLTNGFTTPIDPDATGVILRFPAANKVNGSIAGHVYNPDGSPVGEGVQVHINVAADYQIQTDTNGLFNTQTEFPAVNTTYTVEAFDPSSGLKGRASVAMMPGITNFIDVHMLSRNSLVEVTVLQASGLPAPGAQVELDQGSYPYDAPLFSITDTNGVASFPGLWEGTYSAAAQFTEQSTRLFARGGASAGPNQTALITLRLGATGSVKGTFVTQDLLTPVYGAQVAIGNLGFASTDTNGFFEFDGVPLGTYQIISSDPVTGGNAVTTTTITFNGQTQTVQLVEATLGVVSGLVMDPYQTGFVPGATVSISFGDGLTPSRTVTTGPNGGFNFPGSPMGTFSLSAKYYLPGAINFPVFGQANGLLSAASTNVSINIQLQPLSYLAVHVVREDGVTPASNALVDVAGQQQNTSANGDALFSNLAVPASYSITAVSQLGGDLHDGAETNLTLTGRGTNPVVTLMLPGVGSVIGTVVGSDGTTPVNNAQVTLEMHAPLFFGDHFTALSDAQGRFTFNDVALGPFLVTAASASLGASENGTLSLPGQTNVLLLKLGASGSLLGVIVRADGVTPVGDVDVAIDYNSQSANPGRALYHTRPDGSFRFNNVPVGPVHLDAADPDFDGIIDFTTSLTSNGQALNLGNVPFDELIPAVVQVTPADTTLNVPITNSVALLFNKPLDTNSIDPSGIFIRGINGIVKSTVTLLPDTNGVLDLVRIQPLAPLQSKSVYSVFVLSGDLLGATGALIGSGPHDLVGRTLAATFVSSFATADNTPPQLLSIFPSNNAVQIDPSAVPRLTFDKTLNPTTFVFTVSGPGGLVPGTAGLGLNGQVLSFVPAANLRPNAAYSLVVSNILDLAGNRAVGDPFTSRFATIDTIGPVVASLQIVSNVPPVAGATVPVIATLATNEAGASVRFTQDFNPVGTVTNAPYQVLVQLPRTGSTTIRAIATDQYGNDGQFAQLTINVQLPQPPTVQFSLVSPTNAPVPSGSSLAVAVTASGDTGISNLIAVISGAASGAFVSTNASSLVVQGVVSNTAVAGQFVNVLAQAMDQLGLSSGQRLFTVPVSDGTPPLLAFLSPSNNALLSPGASFPLAATVSDNSSNVALKLVVGGALSVTQNVALTLTPNVALTNTFTVPLAGAPANGGLITASLFGSDSSSNTISISRSFWLPGTVGPAIASLNIASNQPPLGGLTVPIQAVLAAGQSAASVSFFQDSKLVGVVTNAPYEVAVKLPAAGSTTIRAFATDAFGFNGQAAQLVISVQTNVLPSIQFARVTPASGPVPSGSAFSVQVSAFGNPGVFQISGSIAGAASPVSFGSSGTNFLIQGTVPPTALAGQQIVITAQAVDGLSQSSGLKSFNLTVSDGTRPALTVLSPVDNAQLIPGQPFDVAVLVSDNSPNLTLGLSITGAVSTAQSLPLSIVPNTATTNVFVVTLPNEPTNGTPLIATITAADLAGNITTVQRVFWLPGTLTTILSEIQALGQGFACANGQGTFSWPNNNNWSQSQILGDPCRAGSNVVTAPSNWSTTNYPNGTNLDVVLSSVGGGVMNLDVSVALHSLTIEQGSGLTLPSNLGTSLSAVNFYFTGDGSITRYSCCSGNNLFLDGGVMEKTFGTNTFSLDPSIVLDSTGGTLAVDSGTLALPGNNSYYTNGAFNVASNATLLLVPPGNNSQFAGAFTGSGDGTVLLNSGTLSAVQNGLTLDLPPGLFQWTGGTIATGNQLTNAGVLTMAAPAGGADTLAGAFYNTGSFLHSGAGNLDLNSGPGARFENMASGTYQLASDSGIIGVSCCSALSFDNYGLFLKEGSAGTSVVSVAFNNLGGTVDVESGGLILQNSGSSFDQTFKVAAGAMLDPTGGRTTSWGGLISGTGPGQIIFSSGTVQASPVMELNFQGDLFQLAGGILQGPLTNLNVINISGATSSDIQHDFYNAGLVRQTAAAGLAFNSGPGTHFVNQAGATYQFENDSGIFGVSCCSAVIFDNYGVVRKIAGTNESRLENITFNNDGGIVDVETGQLTLANSGSSSNGTFTISAGAVLDLTGGRSPSWTGLIQGTGTGQLLLANGTLNGSSLTLNCAPGLFQWTGGQISGSLLNTNVLEISGSNNVLLSATIGNSSLIRHSSTGTLELNSGPGAHIENFSSGTYRLESDASIIGVSCCSAISFDNYGSFIKIGGTNTATISAAFNNWGGLLDVETGSLTLANNGSSSNAQFTVAAGAALDITGGTSPTWFGQIKGQGAGTVFLRSGTLNASPSLALNFSSNLFQWSGGYLSGVTTNLNTFNISDVYPHLLRGRFDNAGLARHTGSGPLQFDSGPGSVFRNLPGATYQIETDTALVTVSCCSPTLFQNEGLLRKVGGANNTSIGVSFSSLGGTIEVDSGRLTLANNGSSINGTFVVGSGASVDLTGGAQPAWTGRLTGSGAGRIDFSAGQILASGLVLDCSAGLLQWSGGTFNGSVTNANEIDISGGAISGSFFNAGLVRELGTDSLGLNSGAGATLVNLPSGTFQIESDGGVYGFSCCSPLNFTNQGLLRKTAGTNSVISVPFANQDGSIEVDKGTLTINGSGYVQGRGSLIIRLGGTAPFQSGSVSVSGNATLGGPLVVTLTNGYVPSIGDQFQILSGASLGGSFSATQVPGGFVVTNIGSAVFVKYLGPGAQLASGNGGRVVTPGPGLLLFVGSTNSTWRVWSATNLGAPDWLPLGSVSVTNLSQPWRDTNAIPARQRFYRVLRSP